MIIYQIDDQRLTPFVKIPDDPGILKLLHRGPIEPQEDKIVAEAVDEVGLFLPPLDLLLMQKLLLFGR